MHVLRQGLIIAGLRLGLGLLVAPAIARAQTPEEAQTNLDSIRQTLAQSNSKVSEIATALAAALKAQSDISDQRIALGEKLKIQQADIAAANTKIVNLEIQAVSLASDMAAKRDQLADLLSGLMHLQQNPPPALLVSPDNVLDALRGAMVFGAVVPDLRTKADELKTQITQLQTLRDAANVEKAGQQVALAALSTNEAELGLLQTQKQAFADATKGSLASETQNALNLAAKAKDLQQLLNDLQKAKADEEARQSAEAKSAAIAAAKSEATRQEALLGPLKPLSSLKGQLHYPVAGDIIRKYGDDTGLGNRLEGVAFTAANNAIVFAPADGTVAFAGPFRSYGQLLILDAGEGYLVLLAGMKSISAAMGQKLRKGEPVGTMGQGPSSLALLGEMVDHTHPVFYVEFRLNNTPVDPTPWWDAGRKEALK